MRGTTAKRLRREAKRKAVEWYRSLLDEEENNKVSDEQILEYVVKHDYVSVDGTATVSENTLRKFIIQEKKDNV